MFFLWRKGDVSSGICLTDGGKFPGGAALLALLRADGGGGLPGRGAEAWGNTVGRGAEAWGTAAVGRRETRGTWAHKSNNATITGRKMGI